MVVMSLILFIIAAHASHNDLEIALRLHIHRHRSSFLEWNQPALSARLNGFRYGLSSLLICNNDVTRDFAVIGY